jgi:SAM-dependent methyltransferase
VWNPPRERGCLSHMSNYQRYWDTPQSVARYAAAPFLLQGELLALPMCVPGGLEGRKVLDLGCGAGRTTHFLREMGATVTGVDLAAKLVSAARERFPDIEFRVGDMAALEFAAASFDLVLVSFNSLDYLHPKEVRLRGLREFWRVLLPGGALCFSHHNLAALFFGWYRFMRPAKLAYRLRHIVDGSAWKAEAYLPEIEAPGLKAYFGWPKQVVADLKSTGFELEHIFPNDPLLWRVQRALHTDFFTRLSDPWPYYVCRKTGEGGLSSIGRTGSLTTPGGQGPPATLRTTLATLKESKLLSPPLLAPEKTAHSVLPSELIHLAGKFSPLPSPAVSLNPPQSS